MAVDATDFKARFSELACLDNDVVDRWLLEATRYINRTQFGAKADDALAYLAAHLVVTFESDSLGVGEAPPGPITSEREGQVAYTISAAVIADQFKQDSLGGNRYGRRYREILASIFTTRCL